MAREQPNEAAPAASPGETVSARDVMVPLDEYPAVKDTDTLAEAAAVLGEWHIDMSGSVSMPRILLVMNETGEFVGVVRRRDILRGLAPSFLVSDISDHPEKMLDVEIDPNLTELLSDRAEEKLREKAATPVSDVTQAVDATVQADDSLIHVIQQMIRHDQAMLPVLENDHIIGVARSVEVLKAVVELLEPEAADDGDA